MNAGPAPKNGSPMPTEVHGPPSRSQVDGLAALWSRAFAGPPWHASPDAIPQQREVIERHLSRPSCRAVLMVADKTVVAAGWTWSGDDTPDDDLHAAVRSSVGSSMAAWMFGANARVLVELMVDPDQQKQGLGRRVLDALIDAKPSWLLTHPDGAGVNLYRRTGWSTCARLDHHGAPLDVMVRTAPTTEALS